MSTLRVSNIQDTAGGNNSTPAAIANGIAKGWVNFNGTGTTATNQTIRASYNVSSVYKNATGDYTVNFTTALTDANYSVNISCGVLGASSGSGPAQVFSFNNSNALADSSPTTSAFRFCTLAYGGAFNDVARISVAVFR